MRSIVPRNCSGRQANIESLASTVVKAASSAGRLSIGSAPAVRHRPAAPPLPSVMGILGKDTIVERSLRQAPSRSSDQHFSRTSCGSTWDPPPRFPQGPIPTDADRHRLRGSTGSPRRSTSRSYTSFQADNSRPRSRASGKTADNALLTDAAPHGVSGAPTAFQARAVSVFRLPRRKPSWRSLQTF